MDTNKNFYSTDILLLASALISLNFKFDSLQKLSDKKFFFYFERTTGLDNATAKYWAREMTVEVHSLDQSRRYLKSLMSQQK